MTRVILASVDDWEALYVNGECVEQGHSISSVTYLDVVQNLKSFSFKYYGNEETLEKYVEKTGELPRNVEELDKVLRRKKEKK